MDGNRPGLQNPKALSGTLAWLQPRARRGPTPVHPEEAGSPGPARRTLTRPEGARVKRANGSKLLKWELPWGRRKPYRRKVIGLREGTWGHSLG